jgi:hypothetical protein
VRITVECKVRFTGRRFRGSAAQTFEIIASFGCDHTVADELCDAARRVPDNRPEQVPLPELLAWWVEHLLVLSAIHRAELLEVKLPDGDRVYSWAKTSPLSTAAG